MDERAEFEKVESLRARLESAESVAAQSSEGYEHALKRAEAAEMMVSGYSKSIEHLQNELNAAREYSGAEIARLRAIEVEAAALREDAERYRWLRSHSWVDQSLIKSVLNFGPGYQQTKPEELDAAIDAVIGVDPADKTCVRCGGAGHIDLIVGAGPYGEEDEAECPACGGTGAIPHAAKEMSMEKDELMRIDAARKGNEHGKG